MVMSGQMSEQDLFCVEICPNTLFHALVLQMVVILVSPLVLGVAGPSTSQIFTML